MRLLQFIIPGKPTPRESSKFLNSLCSSLTGEELAAARLKELELLAGSLYLLNHRDSELTDRLVKAVSLSSTAASSRLLTLCCRWSSAIGQA